MNPVIPTGTPIAVVAPCGAYDPVRFEAGLELARTHGHDVRPLPGNLQPHRYLAAPDDVRFEQLVEAWTDARFGAVWIARGGYGLTRILDRMPWETLPDKPILGFRDATALFAAMHARGIGIPVHAPVVHSLPIMESTSVAALFRRLAGEPVTLPGRTLVPGTVIAPVVGGNLCLIAACAGTSASLHAQGHILVLEEVGEPAYRIDRMLQQLVSSGVFDGVVGVALGEFVSCKVPDGADYTLETILLEHLEPLGIPVVTDIPVGHGARNHPFVWGQPMRLDAGLHPV